MFVFLHPAAGLPVPSTRSFDQKLEAQCGYYFGAPL